MGRQLGQGLSLAGLTFFENMKFFVLRKKVLDVGVA